MSRARSFDEVWAARLLREARRERVVMRQQCDAAAAVAAACEGALRQLVGTGAALRRADLSAYNLGGVDLQLRIIRKQARRQARRCAAALARSLGGGRRGRAS